jgi:phosphatidylglycerol:prolipoprotein diacylglycerol transferase
VASSRTAAANRRSSRLDRPVGTDYAWALTLAVVIGFLLFHNFVRGGGPFPTLPLGPLRLSVFGLLAALDMLFGIYVIRRWCTRFELDWETLSIGLPWMILIGYYISHLVSVAFYFPHELSDPVALLDPRTRISSFGGIFGGGLVAWIFLKRRGLPVLRYVDPLAYGFIGGYIFGRAGCFAIHDHPGRLTDSPLAVNIAGEMRHDLGFYEMWLMLALFVGITLMARRGRPADGAVVALFGVFYSPVRFLFDSLRIEDPTYAGLTPGQWFAIVLFAIGIWAWRHSIAARPE